MAGTKIRNLPDLVMDDTIQRALVVDLTTQYRGNRVTARFYPDQYAKVVYARWLAQRYGRADVTTPHEREREARERVDREAHGR